MFKDNGVRNFSEIVLALRPGRTNKSFIAVAHRICSFYEASLTILHVVSSKVSEEGITSMKRHTEALLQNIDTNSSVLIIKSDDPITTISKTSASFDLLLLGTPQKDNWLSILFGTGKDKFTETSACSVLRLTMKEEG